MAKELSYKPLNDLGVNGLNTQSNPATLDPSWLTKAENVVIRESGRITLRKGLKQKVVPTGTAIASLVEHRDQSTDKIFASYGTSIYTVDFGSPTAAFPSSGADVKRTVAGSSGDWQFVNFNSRLHCFHSGVVPQRYDGSATVGEKWSNHYTTTAINLANGGSITAPNIVKDTTYKIATVGNTNFTLIGSADNNVGTIFTASTTVALAEGSEITADKIATGKSYKIVALGSSDFTTQSASSNEVGVIFTANTTGGTGTGTVVEVITGTTGTIVEIKTNPTITTITVDSTTGFSSSGKIVIGEEIISYTGKTSTTFTGCTRGSSNTDATYHNDNDEVTSNTAPPSVTAGEFKPSCGCGFYGRLWVGGVAEEKDVIHYSMLLDGDDFTSYSGGGYIDLKTVWGTDEIVAIAPFYGQLAVFGKNNIVLFDSPDIISSMRINEVIRGIGCIARDSVQHIGDDLVFLSDTGLRSLARTSEKDKVPLTDLSLNIKDTLIRNIGNSTNVKSVYVESEGIYIMSFVDKNINYIFDFKHGTPNGAPRITTWTFDSDREPASLAYTNLYGLLVGQQDGGLAGYERYFDADAAAADGGGVTYTDTSYTSEIQTVWLNLGNSVIAALLKRFFIIIEGGNGATVCMKYYKDFSPVSSDSTCVTLSPVTTGTAFLWGATTSLYGATTAAHTHDSAVHTASATYRPIYGLKEYRMPLLGSAKHLKIAVDIQSNGFDLSIQALTLLHKQGKIR